jgi:hypothetical protein
MQVVYAFIAYHVIVDILIVDRSDMAGYVNKRDSAGPLGCFIAC